MTSEPIRILLIEDDEDDYIITRELLAETNGKGWKLDWVMEYDAGLEALASAPPDVALVDYRLGAHSGLELLQAALAAGCDTPIILLTGLGAQEIDRAAMQAGAADYLVKGQITAPLLERSISHALQRKVSERRLRASEEEYRLLFDSNPHPMFLVDPQDGRLLQVNKAAVAHYGYTAGDFLNLQFADLCEGRAPELSALSPGPVLLRHRKEDGSLFDVEITGNPLQFGQRSALLLLAMDVTQRLALEAHVRQAHKMESMGALAGGVAHDFNNLLAIVSAHAWNARENFRTSPEKTVASLDAIGQAVSRGAGLVRQILTFARKQDVQLEPLQLQSLIPEFARMLAETFPRTIRLEVSVAPDLPPLLADSNQLHQTLLNLCVNARDAMTNGGVLRVRAQLAEGESVQRLFPEAAHPHYIAISVSDSGYGMDETTRRRIFEPFFTTKGQAGTGLGLAVVYGIVKAHNGFIDVQSELGKGTTFQLFFPQTKSSAAATDSQTITMNNALTGTETILLVEDEELLRELMKTLLESKGYTVLVAEDGIEALEVFAQNKDKIGLLLADMGLPKLGGWEAFMKMREVRPDLPGILASGYLDPELKQRILRSGAAGFVQKPYLPNELYQRVREALDAKTS